MDAKKVIETKIQENPDDYLLNNQELTDDVHTTLEFPMPLNQLEKIIGNVFEVIYENLADGDCSAVYIANFGVFSFKNVDGAGVIEFFFDGCDHPEIPDLIEKQNEKY